MEWTIAFEPDTQIVLVRTSGVASAASSLALAQAILQAADQHLTALCLIDHRAITAIEDGPAAMFFHADDLRQAGVSPKYRVAEIIPPAHREPFEFLETVLRNRGLRIAMFEDEAAARRWLLE